MIRERLDDGTELAIRPIAPSDVAELRAGLTLLSPEARYLRFHSERTSLSDAEWRYLTEVDGKAHCALVAIVSGRIVAVARYVTVEEGVAEVAFVVADPLQRHGIGRHLRDALLANAAKNGIHTIRANVLSINRPMRRLLECPSLERIGEKDGVIELRLRAPAPPEASEWTGLPLRGP